MERTYDVDPPVLLCLKKKKRFRERERDSVLREREKVGEKVGEREQEKVGERGERLRLREGWDVELTRLRVKGRDKDWR
jgi:hypothetical protein